MDLFRLCFSVLVLIVVTLVGLYLGAKLITYGILSARKRFEDQQKLSEPEAPHSTHKNQ